MEPKTKNYLLELARQTIAKELGISVDEKLLRPDDLILKEKRGVFVTLKISKKLRGCIGNIMPVYALEEAVKNNAINAAFEDSRFSPLTKEEFDLIEIEISVLTVPKKLEYRDREDLLQKLTPQKDGVIVKKDFYEATYLPQVWNEIKDKEYFLSSLCAKAGMNPEEWKKGKLEVMIYEVEAFNN